MKMTRKTINAIEISDEHGEYPEKVVITASGWTGWFHVIYESPEDGDLFYDHKFLSLKALKKKYPDIDIKPISRL